MKKTKRPQFIARKSKWLAVRWWHLLFFWTIIPLLHLWWRCIVLNHQKVEFYDSYVIKKRGVFNKVEEQCMFPKVISCNVKRTFWGRIFNYGDVKVDSIGKWDIDLTGIKKPVQVSRCVKRHFVTAKDVRAMKQNIVTHER